jgi:DNA (cytosine-5)-methyltransferase 1
MGSKASRPAKSPVAVDLFCGAGGLSEGLRQAGFRSVLGLDYDRNAIASYAANHPGAQALHRDVSTLRADEIFEAAGTDQIDLVTGGPSCQGFSTHGKRIEDDPRNFLFREFARIVRQVKPRFFLMENVKGLLAYRGGYFRKAIEDTFGRAGYRVVSGTLCAADFGVPQLRHRVFFIGAKIDDPVQLSLPMPTHGAGDGLFELRPYVTVEEAIGDLPLMHGDFSRSEWEYATDAKSAYQARRIARYVQQGQGLRSVPLRVLPERFRRMRTISTGALRKDCTTLYHRLSPDRPAYTITCYFRNVASGPFLHPHEDRSISTREAARFMSFPDSYVFEGTGVPRQIGNAVPPLLARAVGKHILRMMGRKVSTDDPIFDLANV